MSLERIVGLVTAWVRFYTRGLSVPVADRRVEEILADLDEHIAHERSTGSSDRRIMRAVAWRMLRGVAADLAWRGGQAKAHAPAPKMEVTVKTNRTFQRSAARVTLGVALILSLILVGTLTSDGWNWSVGDFVLAGVLLAAIGGALELAVHRTGNVVLAVVIAALGVAAALLGGADDAPGLVLLGVLLIISGGALGVRRAQHNS
jgi:hypothetical protein